MFRNLFTFITESFFCRKTRLKVDVESETYFILHVLPAYNERTGLMLITCLAESELRDKMMRQKAAG